MFVLEGRDLYTGVENMGTLYTISVATDRRGDQREDRLGDRREDRLGDRLGDRLEDRREDPTGVLSITNTSIANDPRFFDAALYSFQSVILFSRVRKLSNNIDII